MSRKKKVIYFALIVTVLVGIRLYFDYDKYNATIKAIYSEDKILSGRLPNYYSDCINGGGSRYSRDFGLGYYCGGIFPIFSSYDNVRCWWSGGRQELGIVDGNSQIYCAVLFYEGRGLFINNGLRRLFD